MRTVLLCLVLVFVCCYFGTNAEKHHHKISKKNKHRLIMKSKETPDTNATLVQSVNELGDVFIREIPRIMRSFGMDPLVAPDRNQSVHPVNLQLTNTSLHNITNLVNAGDIVVLDDTTTHEMGVSLQLKFYNLKLVSHYNAFVKLVIVPVGSKGVLTAEIPEVKADLKVIVNFKQVNATLDSLVLSMDHSRMKVKLSGNLESELANVAMPIIVDILQGVILDIIQGPLRKQINNIIYEISSLIHHYFDSVQ